MKPDGVSMEPTEAAAGVEPSLSQGAAMQDEITEQATTASQPEDATRTAAPPAAQEGSGKPAAAAVGDPKAKPKAAASKMKPAGASGSNSRPGTAHNRTENGIKPSNNVPAKTTVKKTGASATGAVPKKPMGGVALTSPSRTQTKVHDKKPVGPARTTNAAPGPVNGARTRTTVRAMPTASNPRTFTTGKADRTFVSTTSRPVKGPATSRPASTTSRPTTAGAGTSTATTKPPTTGTAKPAASRVNTAPPAGRTTTAQPLKSTAAAAKKDVSRPAPATGAKKPTMAAASTATKKPEPLKPTATLKPNSFPKRPLPAKAAVPKSPLSKEPQKPTQTKKAAPPTVRLPALNNSTLGRTQHALPANKPAACKTPPANRGPKPTQAVTPFHAAKKTRVQNYPTTAIAQTAAAAAVVVAEPTEVPAETQAEAVVASPEEPSLAASAAGEVPSPALALDTPAEVVLEEAAHGNSATPSPPPSPVRTALPPTSPHLDLVESTTPLPTAQEQVSAPAEPALPPMASPRDLSEEPVQPIPDRDQTPSASKAPPPAANAMPQVSSPSNLNEEEDEEEREGSQQVSVSEMSGTTQPTEESRPGSAGPVGGSAWRAGGALLSELDSEEVSGSHQGASELSAPGVLEGTESMDDLGDASLKGAIDIEGASAGSPDFEKVPDIPVNDFEEDEDDDNEDDCPVCDMDVGSERADDLQKLRHDNELDEEDDEDVEMASEGVTESGLESYGNADEDDFAEDERLDNLNRIAQQPPPPPLLLSAPAAQWDQPNLFAGPWEQPLQNLGPQHVSQPLQAATGAPASPSTDLWQADSETPTQSSAQAWPEVSHHSSVLNEPQKPETKTYMDQSSPAPLQTLAPAPLSALGMSLSSTLSSETSTPEELCDYNQEGNLQLHAQDAQAPVFSLQPDQDQGLGIHLERGERGGEEEAEGKTLPADEVLGGPATAPTSNPSSSSTTEDEASDTEGVAQLHDSLDGQWDSNTTFDIEPPAQRCLSTLEEGDETEVVVGDTTPPSANSAASCGFDTMTTASNSNAQSSGESCAKSPGIFSLEELPDEANEPRLIQEPPARPSPAEQHYMQCGKLEAEPAEDVGADALGSEEVPDPSLDGPDDNQPPYYSTICEKTDNSFSGNV